MFVVVAMDFEGKLFFYNNLETGLLLLKSTLVVKWLQTKGYCNF